MFRLNRDFLSLTANGGISNGGFQPDDHSFHVEDEKAKKKKKKKDKEKLPDIEAANGDAVQLGNGDVPHEGDDGEEGKKEKKKKKKEKKEKKEKKKKKDKDKDKEEEEE